jgi:hypothetical protein
MATTLSPGWSRSRPTSVAMSSVARRAVPATEVSVRENTTFGIGRQIRANSSSASPDMVCSAVSQTSMS